MQGDWFQRASRSVPSGPVEVAGVLQPDEVFYADAPATADEIAAISQSSLESAWGEDVPPGFVVLQDQQPSAMPAPAPVPPTVPTADVPFPLPNFFYAFQWWIFAAFALALAARFLWLDAAQDAAQDAAEAGAQ